MTSRDVRTRHDELEPLVAEHALGTLDPADQARVDSHLVECAACRATFDEVAAATARLEQALVPGTAIQPQPGARDDLLAAARRTPQDGVPRSTRRARPRRARRWSFPAVAAGAGAACSILALVVLLADSRERERSLERRLEDARGDQVAVLRGASIDDLDVAGPFGDARAQVVLQRDAGLVAFRDVPAPPDGMVWQVWTIDADERIHSLGVIEDERRNAYLPIEEVDPEDVERIIVTIEPAGGSTEPTAEEVAEATV